MLNTLHCLQEVIKGLHGWFGKADAKFSIWAWHQCLWGHIVGFARVILIPAKEFEEAMALLEFEVPCHKHMGKLNQLAVCQSHVVVSKIKPSEQRYSIWERTIISKLIQWCIFHYHERISAWQSIMAWIFNDRYDLITLNEYDSSLCESPLFVVEKSIWMMSITQNYIVLHRFLWKKRKKRKLNW